MATSQRRQYDKACVQEGVADAVEYVVRAAPRLLNVAAVTAISFGLWNGANRVLSDVEKIDDDTRQCIAGYRGDNALMTVVRIYQLLDRNPKREPVSFQSVYGRLRRAEVVEALISRRTSESLLTEAFPDRIAEQIRYSVERFLATYAEIDWDDLHGRLKDFRHRGVAHLTLNGIGTRITYEELRRLVYSIVALRECLMPFAPDAAPFHRDEIREWSDRATATWLKAIC